jgi:hypothetical protein
MALASGCCDVMDELEFEVQIQNAFLVGWAWVRGVSWMHLCDPEVNTSSIVHGRDKKYYASN